MPDAMLPLVLQSLPDHREEHALLNSTTYYGNISVPLCLVLTSQRGQQPTEFVLIWVLSTSIGEKRMSFYTVLGAWRIQFQDSSD
jgi:hypothetical protein